MRPVLLLLVLVVGVGVWVVAVAAVMSARRQVAEVRARLAAADRFLDELRENVWAHRDVAPELATIVLDDIRRFRDRADGREIS